MFRFYLDKVLLPITPEKVSIKVGGKNQLINIIDGKEINILKDRKLIDIDFECLLPNAPYPFAIYKKGFVNAQYFIDKLNSLKNKTFRFIITRQLPNGLSLYGTNLLVTLEEFTILEDVKDGFDVKYKIKLKEYRPYKTKVVQVISKGESIKASVSETAVSKNEVNNKDTSYTVKKGDSLWKIAKIFYNDGSKYKKIYLANKHIIKNANKIYPNQVLVIPK